jgi:hypothetical protein
MLRRSAQGIRFTFRSVISAAHRKRKLMGNRTALIISGLALTLAHAAYGQNEPASVHAVVDRYCTKCHDADVAKGDLDLESVLNDQVAGHPEIWEKVARRLSGRQMPPAGKRRPSEEVYASVLSQITTALDRAAAEHPNPGRTDTLRRLTRA